MHTLAMVFVACFLCVATFATRPSARRHAPSIRFLSNKETEEEVKDSPLHLFLTASGAMAATETLRAFVGSTQAACSLPLALHLLVPDTEVQRIKSQKFTFINPLSPNRSKEISVSVYSHAQLAALPQLRRFINVSHCHSPPDPCIEWHARLLLHLLLPETVNLVLTLDMDVRVRRYVDLATLYRTPLTASQLIALAPELNLLYLYKWAQYKQSFSPNQPFQGFNGGVQLQRLDRMRALGWDSYLLQLIDQSRLPSATYSFPIDLQANRWPMRHCEQDVYTFAYLAGGRSRLIASLECGWNRQYCRAGRWNTTLLDQYHECRKVYIDHFNCASTMREKCRPQNIIKERMRQFECLPYM